MIYSLPLTNSQWLLSTMYALLIAFVVNEHHESFLLPDYIFVKRLDPSLW